MTVSITTASKNTERITSHSANSRDWYEGTVNGKLFSVGIHQSESPMWLAVDLDDDAKVEVLDAIDALRGDEQVSLVDFCNTRDVSRLFVTSTYVPVGVTYNSNVDTDGDDYCDLWDLLESGLSTESLFHLNGSVNGDRWIWDGQGDVRDYHGNSYLRIECW